MIIPKTNKIRTAITQAELEKTLASVFESHRGKGYYYMDHDHDHPMRETAYDLLLSYFDDNQRRVIESQIQRTMSQIGTRRIMDQGCDHANSLSMITRRFSEQYPENEYHGYGVSGSLNDMWLEERTWENDMTIQQEELLRDHRIYSFKSWNDRAENAQFFGIEDDIHKVMKRFPFPLDLVFSDNTYFHLFMPWLAMKRTADKLAVGGVALIRTLFQFPVDSATGRPMSDHSLVELLGKDNPEYEIISSNPERSRRVLAVVKNGDAEFKTNQYICSVETAECDSKSIRTFYSKKQQPVDFLAIDTL